MGACRRVDVPALRPRARHPPPGRRLPRSPAVGLRRHAVGQVSVAAALPPARDLPPPGAQAGRRGVGDVAAQRPVLPRRSQAQLRLLRPDHHRGLVAVCLRAGGGRRPDRLRRLGRALLPGGVVRRPGRPPWQRARRSSRRVVRRSVGDRGLRLRRDVRDGDLDELRSEAPRALRADHVPCPTPWFAHAHRAGRRRLHGQRDRRRHRADPHDRGVDGADARTRRRGGGRDVGRDCAAGGSRRRLDRSRRARSRSVSRFASRLPRPRRRRRRRAESVEFRRGQGRLRLAAR